MKSNPNRVSAFAVTGFALIFAVVIFCAGGFGDRTAAAETDSSRANAKVCLSVLDQTGASEVAFNPRLNPGPGKSIVTHAVANVPCVLLVVAFNQGDGQLANDWRPQFKELAEEWEEVILPSDKAAWRWEVKTPPFDFYVLFLSAGSASAHEIKALVAAMQDLKEDKSVLRLQANKLHELISRAAGDSDPGKHRATATVTEIHGVTRGQKEFPWRGYAAKVYFDDQNAGLLVFPSGA